MVTQSLPLNSTMDKIGANNQVLFGNTIYRYDIIPTTQDKAREWLDKGAVAGTVITAQAMTAGRGRRGRIWYTPPSVNLSLTAISPPIDSNAIWQLPLLVGMAVADAITDVTGIRPAVRFPNDIVIGERKVAGILVETPPRPRTEDVVALVGIGVNVLAATMPAELTTRAISLEEAGARTTVAMVESAVLTQLTRHWQKWQTEGVEEMLLAYHAYLDPQATRSFVVEGVSVPCRMVRIYANGAVMIETAKGTQRAFHAAQVVLGDD